MMPIKYIAKHICEKCGKAFEWNLLDQRRTHLESGNCFVEEIPNKTLAHSFTNNCNGTYSVAVNCPYCDYDNYFDWSETMERDKTHE